jgi:hypothetical protein
MILELDLEGNLLWEWWATEHGYAMTPSGKERVPGKGDISNLLARGHFYFALTHCGSACGSKVIMSPLSKVEMSC